MQVVPFDKCRQYPSVPNVMLPDRPSTAKEALRKNTDLAYGTEKHTIARRIVAIKVTKKPGVAGRMKDMKEWWIVGENRDKSGKYKRKKGRRRMATVALQWLWPTTWENMAARLCPWCTATTTLFYVMNHIAQDR